MLEKVGVKAKISNIPSDIYKADKLILPGIGSFDYGVNQLKGLDIWEILQYKVEEKKSCILGICLGAQLMTLESGEGKEFGFGWINAKTKVFKHAERQDSLHYKVPHMGWTEIEITQQNQLLKNFQEVPRFYFAHSYHFTCIDKKNVIANANYGYVFPASFQKENIWGVQFHPEKSHVFGMKLMENFVNL